MKKTINKLNPSVMKKAYAKEYTQKEISIEIDGKNYTVLIDEKFKPSKLQNLVSELIEKQKYMTEYQEVLAIPNYIIFLLIKYFSNLEVCEKDSTFEQDIQLFNIMLDLNIVDTIVKAFDENEIKKIDEFIKKASDNIKKLNKNPELVNEFQELMQDIQDKFEDEIIVEDVEDGDDIA